MDGNTRSKETYGENTFTWVGVSIMIDGKARRGRHSGRAFRPMWDWCCLLIYQEIVGANVCIGGGLMHWVLVSGGISGYSGSRSLRVRGGGFLARAQVLASNGKWSWSSLGGGEAHSLGG